MKLSSLTLAKAFMRRVTKELQYKEYEEDLLLQGVRFAFRIHQVTFKTSQNTESPPPPRLTNCTFFQFAGGFDAETKHAFDELRKVGTCQQKP